MGVAMDLRNHNLDFDGSALALEVVEGADQVDPILAAILLECHRQSQEVEQMDEDPVEVEVDSEEVATAYKTEVVGEVYGSGYYSAMGVVEDLGCIVVAGCPLWMGVIPWFADVTTDLKEDEFQVSQ